MGRKIFGSNIWQKLIIGMIGVIILSTCYAAPGFGPVIEALQAGFAQVVEQTKAFAGNTMAKLTNLEKINDQNVAHTSRIAALNQTLSDTIGTPLGPVNAEQIKTATFGWMRDYVTDPGYTLGAANALEIPVQKINFVETPTEGNIGVDYVTTHRQVENKLVAHNNTPAEAKRLAALREYMIENATVSGVALATTNKQTLNKTRNKIKKIADAATDSKSLREDLKATNAYLMVVALELTSIRELQAQQLELLSAFSRTFISPMSHMQAKQQFRQQRGVH